MMNRVTVTASRFRAATHATWQAVLTKHQYPGTSNTVPIAPITLLPSRLRRYSATPPPPSSRRRAVTPFNDDGHVPWTELSTGEKTARAAQQTFNLGLVVVGLVLTGGVGYFLFTEVFSPDSKVSNFNRAVDRIKADPRCIRLLGDPKKITAYGEETNNKWRRARPISSTSSKDAKGNEHLLIGFNVQGPRATGRVALHLIKRPDKEDYEYQYFFVEIPRHERIYLENAAAQPQGPKKGGFKFLGLNWG